jgi:hypothetical protein
MNLKNRTLVPGARHNLDEFKVEIASEVGITNYETVDKGNLTSRQNRTVGGIMVKRMVNHMKKVYQEQLLELPLDNLNP